MLMRRAAQTAMKPNYTPPQLAGQTPAFALALQSPAAQQSEALWSLTRGTCLLRRLGRELLQ